MGGESLAALQRRLQQSSGGVVPYQGYLMLPYALPSLAPVVMARRAADPRAQMKAHRKGERRWI
jgi:simple sugar transport system permease protein